MPSIELTTTDATTKANIRSSLEIPSAITATLAEAVLGQSTTKLPSTAGSFSLFEGLWIWDFLRASTFGNTGSGNAALSGTNLISSTSTGATASSTTGFSVAIPNQYNSGGANRMSWDRPMGFWSQIQSANVTTNGVLRMFIGGVGSVSTTYADPGRRSFGFDIRNLRLWVLAHNGTTLTQTDSGFTLTAGVTYHVYCYSDGAGNISVYLNGTLRGSATGGPTSAATSTDACMSLLQTNGGDAAATRWSVSPIKLLIPN